MIPPADGKITTESWNHLISTAALSSWRKYGGQALQAKNTLLSIRIFFSVLQFFLKDFNFYLFIYFLNFIYLFLAVLGLHFCARAFSSCGKRGPLFIAVRGPFTVATSLVAGHRLQTRRLSSCSSRAQLLRGMWDLPRPGLEPVPPALAGRFSTTAPPGKPSVLQFLKATPSFRIFRPDDLDRITWKPQRLLLCLQSKVYTKSRWGSLFRPWSISSMHTA